MVKTSPNKQAKETAETLAPLHALHVDHTIKTREAMCRHRLRIIQHWGLDKGEHVLELGCGHGEMTLALAAVVGPEGHVTGIDNAPPTCQFIVLFYHSAQEASCKDGAPVTVGDAQATLKRSRLGPRIDAHFNTTIDSYFADRRQSPRKQHAYTAAVFCQSLWYFRSRTELLDTFKSLWAKTPAGMRLCLAEWGLVTSSVEANPHLHAVLTQQQLEHYKASSRNNMRTLLSPASIKELAYQAGWEVSHEGFFETAPDVQDGRLETGIVLSARWWTEVENKCKELEDRHPNLLEHIRQYWEACDMATDTVGIANVRCMDMYYVVLVKRETQDGILEPAPRKPLLVSAERAAGPSVDRAQTNAPSRRRAVKREKSDSSDVDDGTDSEVEVRAAVATPPKRVGRPPKKRTRENGEPSLSTPKASTSRLPTPRMSVARMTASGTKTTPRKNGTNGASPFGKSVRGQRQKASGPVVTLSAPSQRFPRAAARRPVRDETTEESSISSSTSSDEIGRPQPVPSTLRLTLRRQASTSASLEQHSDEQGSSSAPRSSMQPSTSEASFSQPPTDTVVEDAMIRNALMPSNGGSATGVPAVENTPEVAMVDSTAPPPPEQQDVAMSIEGPRAEAA